MGKTFFTASKAAQYPAGIVKVLAGQGDKIDLELLVQKAIENMEGDVLKSYTAMPFLRAYGLAEKDGKLRVFTVPKVVHMLARWLGMVRLCVLVQCMSLPCFCLISYVFHVILWCRDSAA